MTTAATRDTVLAHRAMVGRHQRVGSRASAWWLVGPSSRTARWRPMRLRDLRTLSASRWNDDRIPPAGFVAPVTGVSADARRA
ncbi:MAG: hypothetical protein CMH16_13835 [Methylobacterium sp.]|nr:hypothetical protein [Methylobacterium sp.]